MRKTLELSIYKFNCQIECEEESVLNALGEDFSFFLSKSHFKKCHLQISVQKVENYGLPKGMIATNQTQNAITYLKDDIKYHDYYGDALTITRKNSIEVQYKNPQVLHEILYLIILSYSGKYMDTRGLHKVHACGVTYKDSSILVMMPSKGGKTTLMLDLIMDPEVSIISDDSPVITNTGKIDVFPLRIGVEDKNDLIKRFPYIDEREIYSFERKYFSKKHLLSLTKLQNKIFAGGKRTILVNGIRYSGDEPKLKKVGKYRMFKHLSQHMIIGIGLPLIIEHFFRIGWKDYFTNIYIFSTRFWAALMLVLKSEPYELYLSHNRMKNREVLLELASEG